MGGSGSKATPSAPAAADLWVDATGIAATPVVHKGLLNEHANNCFLNVSLQCLWHVAAFRNALLDQPVHKHAHDAVCMTCALRELYTFYRSSEGDAAVPPDVVRNALADLNAAEDKFRLGEMADASETLLAIFAALHTEALKEGGNASFRTPTAGRRVDAVQIDDAALPDALDVPCDPACPAHAAFGYDFFSWYRCLTCGATGEPQPGSDLMYQVYVADVVAVLERLAAETAAAGSHVAPPHPSRVLPTHGVGGVSPQAAYTADRQHPSLGLLLGSVATSDLAACAPAKARDPHAAQASDVYAACRLPRCIPERYALTLPRVFLVSLAWPSASTSKEEAAATMDILGQMLDLRTVFKLEPDERATAELETREARAAASVGNKAGAFLAQATRDHVYRLRGIVCYYGKHYVCFIASEAERRWILFDDKRLAIVGAWPDVVHRCVQSRYQPTVLLYEQMTREVAPDTGEAEAALVAPSIAPAPVSTAPPALAFDPIVVTPSRVVPVPGPVLIPTAAPVSMTTAASGGSGLLATRSSITAGTVHVGDVTLSARLYPVPSAPADEAGSVPSYTPLPIDTRPSASVSTYLSSAPAPAPAPRVLYPSTVAAHIILVSLPARALQRMAETSPARITMLSILGVALTDVRLPPDPFAMDEPSRWGRTAPQVTSVDLPRSLYGTLVDLKRAQTETSIVRLRPGDIILRVDSVEVYSRAQADARLQEAVQKRVARCMMATMPIATRGAIAPGLGRLSGQAPATVSSSRPRDAGAVMDPSVQIIISYRSAF